MAQDVWSLGYLVYWLLTQKVYFTTTEGTWEAVCQKQDTWVSMARQLKIQVVVKTELVLVCLQLLHAYMLLLQSRFISGSFLAAGKHI